MLPSLAILKGGEGCSRRWFMGSFSACAVAAVANRSGWSIDPDEAAYDEPEPTAADLERLATEVAADTSPEAADIADEPGQKFPIVDPQRLPHPVDSRKNYSFWIGGGRGVLVAPHWAMTAAHCITSQAEKTGRLSAIVKNQGKKVASRKANLVVRYAGKDVALVRLETPFPVDLLEPPLLLKDTVRGKQPVLVKKVAATMVWTDIPAFGKTDNWFVPKAARQGKAGTSGSPWLVHSDLVGDVLVGITHGSGRAPQIGYLRNWIADTVAQHSDDALHWATLEQALVGQEKARAAIQAKKREKKPS